MRQEKGNSVLELLLFLPIALFFLFIVIDAGLSLIQRSAISDAYRSGVSALPAYIKAEHTNYHDQEQLYTQALSKVVNEISNNTASVFASYDSAAGSFEVYAKLYRVQVDPLSGKLLSQTPELVANFKQGSITNENLLKSFTTESEYLEKVFNNDLLNSISSFAEPLAFINSPVDSTLSGQRYAAVSWLVYSEVRAIPVGINSSFLQSALGGVYSLQVQGVEKVRDY